MSSRVLTPKQALRNRINADYRNIRNITSSTSNETLACLIADCSSRWRSARNLDDNELLYGAEHNLDLVSQIWEERHV